ncbi:2428_t:CDS:2, partial [Acaulospora colombiana]
PLGPYHIANVVHAAGISLLQMRGKISRKAYWRVDVIAPTLRFRLLSTPICALLALNTVANYYWAITIPPGFADEDFSITGQRRHPQQTRRVGKCMKCGSVKPE